MGELYEESHALAESCGVFGILSQEYPLVPLAYLALQALQHRGQQGAGISAVKGDGIQVYQDLGLVRDVFGGGKLLEGLPSDSIVVTAQNRYSTVETPAQLKRKALQPMLFDPRKYIEADGPLDPSEYNMFSFSHNGNVEGLNEVAQRHQVDLEGSSSDSEDMMRIIGAEYLKTKNLVQALRNILPEFKGAFSLVLSTPTELIGARDPQGFRPLHLGRKGENGWVMSSEIGALDIVGAEPIREIEPGEIVHATADGITEYTYAEAKPALCSFEFVYFSRPDNEMFGETVVSVRERMGEILGRREKVTADMVIGVPESGIAAADGFSRVTGIPHLKRLVRNNYVDRAFIQATANEQRTTVRSKLNPIRALLKNKSAIIVDDSIVRGTTLTELIQMFREAGVVEIHARITSPPYKWPCYYGMNTKDQSKLLAALMRKEEMRKYIGVDTLEFLTDDELQEAAGAAAGKLCTACTTGIYPVEVPIKLSPKLILAS